MKVPSKQLGGAGGFTTVCDNPVCRKTVILARRDQNVRIADKNGIERLGEFCSNGCLVTVRTAQEQGTFANSEEAAPAEAEGVIEENMEMENEETVGTGAGAAVAPAKKAAAKKGKAKAATKKAAAKGTAKVGGKVLYADTQKITILKKDYEFRSPERQKMWKALKSGMTIAKALEAMPETNVEKRYFLHAINVRPGENRLIEIK